MLSFERKLNLLVGIPSGEAWTRQFGMSMLNMMGHLMAKPVPGFRDQTTRPFVLSGSILSRARAKIVQEARKQKSTHILFIDTDQSFPRDTAHRLIQHRKSVVACNIATKQIPASPTARAAGGIDGVPIFTDLDSSGLEKVWRIGTGLMLCDVRVFDGLNLGDVFPIKWRDEIEDFQGEDWSMCEALHAAGVDLWIDHDLSKEVRHWGMYGYGHHVVGSTELVEMMEEPRGRVVGEA